MTKKEIQQELDKLSEGATLEEFLLAILSKIDLVDLSLINVNIIQVILNRKILNQNHIKNLYKEQLIQTEMYLSGNMYTNEKTQKEMLPKQLQNIHKVLQDGKDND